VTTKRKVHGREEGAEYFQFPAPKTLARIHGPWKGLKSIRDRDLVLGPAPREETIEIRYYIRAPGCEVIQLPRGSWANGASENQRVMSFGNMGNVCGEDESRRSANSH